MKLSRLVPVIVVLAIFTAIGIVVGLTANWFPVQASVEANSVDALFNFMLAIATVIFLIVEGGIIYVIVRFRAKKGDTSDGRNYHGNTALEVTWTAIPAVIVFVLAILSFQVFADLRTPGENATVITAVGQQFQWSFHYKLPANTDPNLTDEQRQKLESYMVSSNLYVPLNKPVTMNIEALDVMHGFFIPELRIKQDAIPGRVENTYFTATVLHTPDMEQQQTQAGDVNAVWWVECSLLCGSGHGNMSMVSHFYVVEQADYDKFIDDMYQKGIAILNDPRNPEVGKQLMASGHYPCKACHTLADAYPDQQKIGPDLDGIATRAADHAAKGEGTIGGSDAAAYIRTSIVNPNAYVVSGFQPNIMPQIFGDRSVMPEDDLEAIVNYLLTQTAP
ncbi:MAG: c-type cytochrome [Anaerolineae bacterium]|nr:c-type cytochrome [Anaerolineae bacterium]